MKVNLYPDSCSHYEYFRNWINGKELAVVNCQNPQKFNATARNRLNYCIKQGYIPVMGWDNRNAHLDDIYQINTSKKERQGREMEKSYFDYPSESKFTEKCCNHYVEWFGISKEDRIYAYCELYIIGQYAHISRILGHGDYMNDGIMLMLIDTMIRFCQHIGVHALAYYLWNSGTEGLKYFKHSVGFRKELMYD